MAPFPGGSDSKESVYNVGALGSIPRLERFPGEGHGNPLQYSCLENPMGRGAWQATVHGVAESDMTELLQFHFHIMYIHSFLDFFLPCRPLQSNE